MANEVRIPEAWIRAYACKNGSEVQEIVLYMLEEYKQDRWKALQSAIASWYQTTYPADDIVSLINAEATFQRVLDALCSYEDVYDVLGVGDSLVRERVFQEIARLLEIDYRVLYGAWIGEPEALRGVVESIQKEAKE